MDLFSLSKASANSLSNFGRRWALTVGLIGRSEQCCSPSFRRPSRGLRALSRRCRHRLKHFNPFLTSFGGNTG